MIRAMGRFVAGAIAAMLLIGSGLFWWQIRADGVQPESRAQAAIAPPRDDGLPVGDESLEGTPPPMPVESRPQDREARRFARYDRDRNEQISRTEMLSSRTKDFRKLDKDGNNLLSFEEWAVKTAERFEGADANHDGRLSRAEFTTTAPKRTARPKCGC